VEHHFEQRLGGGVLDAHPRIEHHGREPGDAERSDVAALVPSPRTRPVALTKRVVVFDLTVPYDPVEAPTAGFGEAGR
jgi:hypothetical protein